MFVTTLARTPTSRTPQMCTDQSQLAHHHETHTRSQAFAVEPRRYPAKQCRGSSAPDNALDPFPLLLAPHRCHSARVSRYALGFKYLFAGGNVAHHAYGVGSGGIAGVGSRQTILAYYSMRGVEFEQRVAAASTAGFDGIGFGVGEYLQLRANGTSDDDLKQVLSQHNMRILELEALRLVDDKSALDFEHVARTFGVERVQVIAPFGANKDIDFDLAAKWLGALAERTADADVHYALEFLPPTKIPDIATAQNFVRRSGHPHVGLCVDTWHVFRGAGMSSLADLDYSLVKNIQVDDGTMTPSMDDYIQDCIHNRELLGAGEFDLEQFFERTPPNAPISVEIIDDDLDLIPAFERAQLQASSLQRLMARCYRQD